MNKVLKFIPAVVAVMFITGCNQQTPVTTTPPAPVTADQGASVTISPAETASTTCAALEHSCPCATGNYCLRMGAMCLSPDSACPNTSEPTTPVETTPSAGSQTVPAENPVPAPSPIPAAAESKSISIVDFAFSPATVTVKAGATVNWKNNDSAMHNVVTTSGPASFSSPNLEQGKSFSFKFTTPGTYAYHCAFHPTMKGTIIVE